MSVKIYYHDYVSYMRILNTPPQLERSPSAIAKRLALIEGNGLVRVSAIILSVEQ